MNKLIACFFLKKETLSQLPPGPLFLVNVYFILELSISSMPVIERVPALFN